MEVFLVVFFKLLRGKKIHDVVVGFACGVKYSDFESLFL